MNDEQFKEFIGILKKIHNRLESIDISLVICFLALIFIGGCISFHK